jgi:Dyp-type peroxidase family
VALFEPDSDLVTGPLVPGAPQEPELDTGAIQGVVLPGFGTTLQHLLGVSFTDSDAARRWLGRWITTVSTLEEVHSGRNQRRRALRHGQDRPRTPLWTGLALSADGLRLLGADPQEIGDTPFSVGLWQRSGLLGDPTDPQEEGHRTHWRVGGDQASTPHVLVILGGEDSDEIDRRVLDLAQDPDGALGYQQRGELLPGDKEHFGFQDGVSQVGIRGRLSDRPRHFLTRRWIDPADERAKTWARPGQPLVWPGQFVFGYPEQDRTDHLVPAPAADVPDWGRNGSLLVFRRLRQDVPRFRGFTAAESARLRAEPGFERWTQAAFEAALVGRWPDGSALMRTDGQPDPHATEDMLAVNYFHYGEEVTPAQVCSDPGVAREGLAVAPAPDELRAVGGAPADVRGDRCPRFAHVRKVNPRDRTTDQGGPEATLTTQVLRRGITWGAPFEAGEAPEAADRGLLFMCWQTDIEQQFELLSTKWMNREVPPETLGTSGHDLLVGQATTRRCTFRGAEGGSSTVATSTEWIVPTGGGYFFGPSLPTLRALAEGGAHRISPDGS